MLGGGKATIGQILLMSKEALERRVLANRDIQIYACGQRDIRAGLDAGGHIIGSGQGNGDRPEESGSRFKVAAHAFPVGVRHEAVERGKAADAQHDQIAAFARTHRHFRQRARPSLFGGQRGAFQQQGFEACATMRRNQFGQGELLLFKSGRNGIVVIFGAQGSTRDRSDLSIYFIDE